MRTKEGKGKKEAKRGGEAEERKEPSVTALLEHITHPDFPLEILRKILGFSLQSAADRWDISAEETSSLKAGSWKAIVSQPRGLMLPENLSWRVREVIRRTAADIFAPSAIVGLPAKFGGSMSRENGLRLIIPFALEEAEHRLRNLVMNVRLVQDRVVGTGPYPHELKTAIDGMKAIAQSLPQLETCVFVINAGPGTREPSCTYREPGLFSPEMLEHGWFPVGDRPSRCKEKMIEFIDALARRGPGKRRFFRIDNRVRGSTWPTEYSEHFCEVGIGPLVRVHPVSESVDNDWRDVDSPPLREARRLLDQAYRLKRKVRCRVHLL